MVPSGVLSFPLSLYTYIIILVTTLLHGQPHTISVARAWMLSRKELVIMAFKSHLFQLSY